MVEQVKSRITEAFHNFSKKDGIQINNIRVKIVKTGSELDFELLNKKQYVRKTDLNEIVGSMTMLMFGAAIKKQLFESVDGLINENELSAEGASFKIYPDNDYSPLVHLFNNKKSYKSIKIENLLN